VGTSWGAPINTSSWDVRWPLGSGSLRKDKAPMPRDERYKHVRAGPVDLLLIVNCKHFTDDESAWKGRWAKGRTQVMRALSFQNLN
jgi:hypothetical protein